MISLMCLLKWRPSVSGMSELVCHSQQMLWSVGVCVCVCLEGGYGKYRSVWEIQRTSLFFSWSIRFFLLLLNTSRVKSTQLSGQFSIRLFLAQVVIITAYVIGFGECERSCVHSWDSEAAMLCFHLQTEGTLFSWVTWIQRLCSQIYFFSNSRFGCKETL